MGILLFPVKPPVSSGTKALVSAVGVMLLTAGCGYRSAYDRPLADKGLTVVASPFHAPHLAAVQEALAGAREELSRAGVSGSSGYPHLVLELLRVDELSAGIHAAPGQTPLGRGSTVGVTVRAWVEEQPGGPHVRDTGDVRRVETVAQSSDALAGGYASGDAARAAARRAGQAAALRVLGIAEPSVEPM